jgi:hypothetical protein
MSGESTQRPSFVGDRWNRSEQGYHYASAPPPDLADDHYLQSDIDWLVFLCVFEKAKAGDWSRLNLLPQLVQRNWDPYLSGEALDLLGAAGPKPLLKEVIPFMFHPVYDIRLDAYAAAGMSYDLMFMEPLLKARTQHLSGERGMIANVLSDLLESKASAIAEPMRISHQAYEELVRKTAKEVVEKAGPGVPVFEGSTLQLKHITDRILAFTQDRNVQDYAGTLMDLLHRFEAMTGVPRPGLFEGEGTPLTLSIRALVIDFIEKGGLAKFQPGQRYFFGHAIP